MRKEIVEKYSLHYDEFDFENPVSIGNGDFCYTADQTGFQTNREYYKIPLTCMTNRIWAGHDVDKNIELNYYQKRNGDKVLYMTNSSNKYIYDELRINHYKFSLFTIAINTMGI